MISPAVDDETEKPPEAKEVHVVWAGWLGGWVGHSETLAACIKRATHTVTQAGELCVRADVLLNVSVYV